MRKATTDAPCVNFTDELLKMYPTAKVILTNRDLDSWIKSIENSFFRVLEWPAWLWISRTHPVRSVSRKIIPGDTTALAS